MHATFEHPEQRLELPGRRPHHCDIVQGTNQRYGCARWPPRPGQAQINGQSLQAVRLSDGAAVVLQGAADTFFLSATILNHDGGCVAWWDRSDGRGRLRALDVKSGRTAEILSSEAPTIDSFDSPDEAVWIG